MFISNEEMLTALVAKKDHEHDSSASEIRQKFLSDLKTHGFISDHQNTRKGFMCKTDFDFELGEAAGGNVVYAAVEDLVNRRGCTNQCGIVEVEVREICVVQNENFDSDNMSENIN